MIESAEKRGFRDVFATVGKDMQFDPDIFKARFMTIKDYALALMLNRQRLKGIKVWYMDEAGVKRSAAAPGISNLIDIQAITRPSSEEQGIGFAMASPRILEGEYKNGLVYPKGYQGEGFNAIAMICDKGAFKFLKRSFEASVVRSLASIVRGEENNISIYVIEGVERKVMHIFDIMREGVNYGRSDSEIAEKIRELKS